MESHQPKEQGQHSKERAERRRVQAQKDGRSRMHRMIRDRVVGSNWFGRVVMCVIVLNAILLWPWTDDAKRSQPQYADDMYATINNFFIVVYLAEFCLKVCRRHVK